MTPLLWTYIKTMALPLVRFGGIGKERTSSSIHRVDNTDTSTGVSLSGFREPIEPTGMLHLNHQLSNYAHQPGMTWYGSNDLLPLTVEEKLAKAGILALCWKVYRSCVSIHSRPDPSSCLTPSRVEGHYSIQCPFRPQSLTMRLLLSTPRGPSVFLPSSESYPRQLWAATPEAFCLSSKPGGSRAWSMVAIYIGDNDIATIPAWESQGRIKPSRLACQDLVQGPIIRALNSPPAQFDVSFATAREIAKVFPMNDAARVVEGFNQEDVIVLIDIANNDASFWDKIDADYSDGAVDESCGIFR